MGAPLLLQGHGTRERELRGPAAPGQPPKSVSVRARRYRCLGCGAVSTVVPRSMLARRRYSGAAIALALALWGLLALGAAEVRRKINPDALVGSAAAGSWATLKRWARAVQQRALFPTTPLPPGRPTARRVAAAAAAALAGQAGPDSRSWPSEHRAFEAAARPA